MNEDALEHKARNDLMDVSEVKVFPILLKILNLKRRLMMMENEIKIRSECKNSEDEKGHMP